MSSQDVVRGETEKLRTIAAFGGELMIEPSIGGQIAPDLIPRMIERAKRIAEEDGAYPTDQFHNEDALVGYREIVTELLPQVDTPIDAFCGGIGTGGMVAGISRAFRERGATTEVVALEPASSPMLSEGRSGSHHIEGVGIGFVPPMVHDDDYARVFGIEEAATRSSRPRSTREEGIFAGTSSGMNVVTVAVDFGLKYLAGDLFSARRRIPGKHSVNVFVGRGQPICTDKLIVTATACGVLPVRPGAGVTTGCSQGASGAGIGRCPIRCSGFPPLSLYGTTQDP